MNGQVDTAGTGLVLGLESSCDETAAAVVRGGRAVLSNVVASQVELHAAYGGVVPELASREHLRNVVPVVREAMRRAGVSFGELDAVAVTEGPGLAGALLVGIVYAKALAWGLGRPLIGVNHLDGHIHSVLMAAGEEFGAGPLMALVVSGGHTHLYLGQRHAEGWRYRNVGRTVDDAAGEAYDKAAKLLGLPYPGGPWMDRLAGFGDAAAVRFNFGPIKLRGADAESDGPRFDFSFSGIKTAVLRFVEAHPAMAAGIAARRAAGSGLGLDEMRALCDGQTLGLIASFQAAVVGVLARQAFAAAETFGARGMLVSGGVAANGELRRRFASEAARRALPVAFPAAGLSTDNAAMIAAAAWPKLMAEEFAGAGMNAQPGLRLGV